MSYPHGQSQPFRGQAPVAPPQQFQFIPGQTGIQLDASKLAMQWGVQPKVMVGGWPVPNVPWGDAFVPVSPGQYVLSVSTVSMGAMDFGGAHTLVPVQAGYATRVYYRSPAQFFMKGAIGAVPQQTHGIVLMYLAWAVIVLIIIGAVALALV